MRRRAFFSGFSNLEMKTASSGVDVMPFRAEEMEGVNILSVDVIVITAKVHSECVILAAGGGLLKYSCL
jgi:hypothetical protein